MVPKANLHAAIRYCRDQILNCGLVRGANNWQGIKAPQPMFECFEVSFRAPIPDSIYGLQREIKPNLPWADEQFVERISGSPLNPGLSYLNWPYYARDKQMRTEVHGMTPKGIETYELESKFTHTYMERFWPKYAGNYHHIHTGIRYEYGDLNDVIDLLAKDKYTRHAYLPIFFPEDTGKEHRIPCTLGYLFYFVGDFLHITYYIRSCDYLRHLRDDIYLACRLNHHFINLLCGKYPGIAPGYLTMHIANLHIFESEKALLEKEIQKEKSL